MSLEKRVGALGQSGYVLYNDSPYSAVLINPNYGLGGFPSLLLKNPAEYRAQLDIPVPIRDPNPPFILPQTPPPYEWPGRRPPKKRPPRKIPPPKTPPPPTPDEQKNHKLIIY